ncbi:MULTISPECIES: hypothetical protein [Hymenobacter]|uniref:Roadblock/LC7 domain-containing protein n=1 Tax=Hymenobacter actinosclerus TaxID=82805 RepID=A0A1I0I8K0_9BACT|nr:MULTISPECIES: hypothetical protein [Hymenobacter]SET93081.1 hypothetical protein SAMN04487998_3217 [Hymenobacter actinosclerus]
MNIPFLHHLQSLTGPPLNKIVGVAPAGPGRANAEGLLRRVLGGLPELVAAAVGEVADGRLLASYTSSKDFDPAKIIGFNAAVLRQQQQALKALGLSEQQEQLTELLITLRRQLHLLRLLPDGKRFLYVAVDCHDTNLAIAREVMRTCDT